MALRRVWGREAGRVLAGLLVVALSACGGRQSSDDTDVVDVSVADVGGDEGDDTAGVSDTGGDTAGVLDTGGDTAGVSDTGGDTAGVDAAGADTVGPGGCPIFPSDNPWNTDISAYAVHADSDTFIDSIGRDTGLHPDFGTVWEGAPVGIPYVVVPGAQPRVEVTFAYADESDAGPYPIPAEAPIEGGPDATGDRHVLVIDRDACVLYELFDAWPVEQGARWTAGSGAIFDLRSNALRPETWTSADAAGLPVFPGLARYDEVVEDGVVDHALRFTVSRTQRGYVHPATHYASSSADATLPPMGLRVRMKAGYDCSGYASEVQVICTALKRYGMLVADNGSDWYVSGAPDPRWSDDNLRDLRQITGDAFEVVDTGAILTY